MKSSVEGWEIVALLGAAAGCGDSTAPDEARFPIVEGIYNVETRTVSNTCPLIRAVDGARIYVFFQNPGGELQFRPPEFGPDGALLLDLGIEGRVEPDGDFALNGSYLLKTDAADPGLVVGFSMQGRFTDAGFEGIERQLPAFPGRSCEVVFSLRGEEV